MNALKAAYTTLIKSLLIAGSFDVSLHAGVNFITPMKSLPDCTWGLKAPRCLII